MSSFRNSSAADGVTHFSGIAASPVTAKQLHNNTSRLLRPSTAKGLSHREEWQARVARLNSTTRPQSAGVRESWCQASEDRDGASEMRERDVLTSLKIHQSQQAVQDLLARQRDRRRMNAQREALTAASVFANPQQREMFLQQAMSQRIKLSQSPQPTPLDGDLPSAVSRSVVSAVDHRPVDDPDELSRELQHTLNHANTRLNDTELQLQHAKRSQSNDQIVPPSATTSNGRTGFHSPTVTAIGERAIIASSRSDYKGEESEATVARSGLATMLEHSRRQNLESVTRGADNSTSSLLAQLYRPDASSAATNGSREFLSSSSLSKKLDALQDMLALRSRGISSSTHSQLHSGSVSRSSSNSSSRAQLMQTNGTNHSNTTTFPSTPTSQSRQSPDFASPSLAVYTYDSAGNKNNSNPESTAKFDAADQVVKQMIEDANVATNSTDVANVQSPPLELLDASHVSVSQWLSLLGYSQAFDLHSHFLRYVNHLRSSDAETGERLKPYEWSRLVEELGQLDSKQVVRVVMSSIALALSEYQREATDTESDLNRMFATDPLANRERAAAIAITVNLRADIANDRFRVTVFKHLHALHRIPGPPMDMRSLLHFVSLGRTAANAQVRPASAQHQHRGRKLVRQKHPAAPKVASRPISAPMVRKKLIDQKLIKSIADDKHSHQQNTGAHQSHVPVTSSPLVNSNAVFRPISARVQTISAKSSERHPARPASAFPTRNKSNEQQQSHFNSSPSTDSSNPSSHPLSSLMSPDDAGELLSQLNMISVQPKLATAYPSHYLSSQSFQQQMEENPYAQLSPRAASIQESIRRHRDADDRDLEWQRSLLQGRVSAVANEIVERQTQLAEFHTLLQEERKTFARALQVEQHQRSLLFDQLDEEFENKLKVDAEDAETEIGINRNRVEQQKFEIAFPASMIQHVQWNAADGNSPQENAASALLLATEAPSSPSTKGTSVPVRELAEARPMREFVQRESNLRARVDPTNLLRDAAFSSLSSTAADVFPTFADVQFHLNPFKLPHLSSPSVPQQAFADGGMNLHPSVCTLQLGDLTNFSHHSMSLPPSMGSDAIFDEYFDSTPTASNDRDPDSLSPKFHRPPASVSATLRVPIPRLSVDFQLMSRIAQEKLKDELAGNFSQHSRKSSRKASGSTNQAGTSNPFEVDWSVRMAKEAAESVAAAMRSTSQRRASSVAFSAPNDQLVNDANNPIVNDAKAISEPNALDTQKVELNAGTASEFAAAHIKWVALSVTDEPLFSKRSPVSRRRSTIAFHMNGGDAADADDSSKLKHDSSSDSLDSRTDVNSAATPSDPLTDALSWPHTSDDAYVNHIMHQPMFVEEDDQDESASMNSDAIQYGKKSDAKSIENDDRQRLPNPTAIPNPIVFHSFSHLNTAMHQSIDSVVNSEEKGISPASIEFPSSISNIPHPLSQTRPDTNVSADITRGKTRSQDRATHKIVAALSADPAPTSLLHRIHAYHSKLAVETSTIPTELQQPSDSVRRTTFNVRIRSTSSPPSSSSHMANVEDQSARSRYLPSSANTREKRRMVVNQQIMQQLQQRITRLWSRLQMNSHDMLAVLEKYARAEHAPQLEHALKLWERCAWLYFTRSALLHRHQLKQINNHSSSLFHATDSDRTVIHEGGGVDGHAQLLAVSLQGAHACWDLFQQFGDVIQVAGVPLLMQLLSDLEWRCCSEAVQVEADIRSIHERIQQLLHPEADSPESQANGTHDEASLKSTLIASPTLRVHGEALQTPRTQHSSDTSLTPSYRSLSHLTPRQLSQLAREPLVVDTTRFTKPLILHTRPVIPGEFMGLIRGSSVFQLPNPSLQLSEMDVGKASVLPSGGDSVAKRASFQFTEKPNPFVSSKSQIEPEQKTQPKQPDRPRTASHQTRPKKSANSLASVASDASRFQQAVNKQWNMFM